MDIQKQVILEMKSKIENEARGVKHEQPKQKTKRVRKTANSDIQNASNTKEAEKT